MTSTEELDFRGRWYRAHCERFDADPQGWAHVEAQWAKFSPSAPEALALRDRLIQDRDFEAFRAGLQLWAVKPTTLAFNGFSGQMFVNQLGKAADTRQIADLLAGALVPSSDPGVAALKISEVVDYVKTVQVGAHPAPGHALFLLSYFWALDERSVWPVFWSSAVAFAEYVTGEQLPAELPARYLRFREMLLELDADVVRFERVAHWWSEKKPVFLNSVLVDRCRFAESNKDDLDALFANAGALVAISRFVGSRLADSVSNVLNRPVVPKPPMVTWKQGQPRRDVWVDWTIPSHSGLGLRIWVNPKGVSIGIRPGHIEAGWLATAANVACDWSVDGYAMFAASTSTHGIDVGHHGGRPGEFTYAKWFEPHELDGLDLEAAITDVGVTTQPLIDQLVSLADSQRLESGAGDGGETFEVDDGLTLEERLEQVASELLIDRSFIDDIVALLDERGQVVLYGPPGTGKTYLARKLASALVPDAEGRTLVQFHPSTSYEDFFEGYRPVTSADGTMRYELVLGPLARLAQQAAAHPDDRFVMIIDEINRANLPRVLGELLFLFEYRDEEISTLYRPEKGFSLPANIQFIATMNTADRSIALIDAALRRRFDFVPLVPNDGPMKGLLDRWLKAQHQAPWVGELVSMVNQELATALNGPHLQLGPSYFMKPDLDTKLLRRIWEYNIEPFIEDQFFGDSAQIESFKFANVLARYHVTAQLDQDGNPLTPIDPHADVIESDLEDLAPAS